MKNDKTIRIYKNGITVWLLAPVTGHSDVAYIDFRKRLILSSILNCITS